MGKTGNVSKYFESFKTYIILCEGNKEKFIKIGKTFVSISRRFSCKRSMPYEYRLLRSTEGSPKTIFKLEAKLHKKLKLDKYIPTIKFPGMTECFRYDNKIIKTIEAVFL